MLTAGIRDLKVHLSRYLKAVSGGEEIVVTDHGRPIARIVREPAHATSTEQRLAALATSGQISLPTRDRDRTRVAAAVVGGRPVSEYV